MSSSVYFDTSALLRWAFHIAGSPEPRDARGFAAVEALIQGQDRLALSPVTLIEFSSNTHSKVRAQDGWYSDFDGSKAELVQARLMGHIGSGRIAGRNLGPKAFEVAMMYVDQATRVGGVKLLAWDAVHLCEAIRWSLEVDELVQIATSDGDFERFLQVLPELGTRVSVLAVTA